MSRQTNSPLVILCNQTHLIFVSNNKIKSELPFVAAFASSVGWLELLFGLKHFTNKIWNRKKRKSKSIKSVHLFGYCM